MTKDFGWKMRADILRRDAEQKLLVPLREHRWTAEIERVVEEGEYVVITAERNGFKRRLALVYSSGTDNRVFRRLDEEVDLTLFNGQPYKLDEFTRGVSRPVRSADDFHHHLVEWNQLSIPDKIAPAAIHPEVAEEAPAGPRERRLLSEVPIDAIWSRLSRLKSATLARKAVDARAAASGFQLAAASLQTKGDGLAYAVRNAADYFALKDVGNLSQRILNLYYGCLAFAFAEMLAASDGPAELSSIEDMTKQGHGLWTHDGQDEGFGGLAVGPTGSGFFLNWTQSMGVSPVATMKKKPRQASDLLAAPEGSWATMEQLFARIPEVGDLFEDVFSGSPAWVSPSIEHRANQRTGLFGGNDRAETSYILLADDSGRMTAETLVGLRGPIREITPLPSGSRARHFRAAVDHPDAEYWFSTLDVHRSPFGMGGLILPLFGSVTQYRAICFVILYGLSIVVRYRPSLWRRIQEGDLDHMRALVEAFLTTVERVLPEQFLESITGEKMSVGHPASLLG
ncbi:YaaC family protein [Teichococcus aerophilus]|uniref:YaaC family protein n=1 Tax=Teichococcus aerophilus TaxID=1224513 RepID=UPI0019D5A75F|nr:hypothetical protein [Pseudoroseomonas aerophila]